MFARTAGADDVRVFRAIEQHLGEHLGGRRSARTDETPLRAVPDLVGTRS